MAAAGLVVASWSAAAGAESASIAADAPGDLASDPGVNPAGGPLAGVTSVEPAVPDAETGKMRSAGDEGWSLVPFVVPAYQPETSFLLGGAAVLSHQPPPGSGLRESQLSFAGAASVRRQFTVLVSPDLFLLDDRMHLGGTLSAARFPDTFYGVGPDTPESVSEPYRANIYELEVSPRWRLLDGLYAGPSVRVQNVAVAEVEAGGLLDGGSISGNDGGTTLQVGISAFWDTRSSTLYPTSGGIVRLSARRAVPALGSDYEFDVLRLDVRRYLALPWGTRHILALQGVLELRDGAPPFYDLARLGGAESMRGYYEGRYRDRQLYAVQAEYRAPLFWRVGAVAFVSAGGVAYDVGSSFFDHPRLGGGGGLRFAPLDDVPVNLRLDLAYGDGLAFYLNVGEAF